MLVNNLKHSMRIMMVGRMLQLLTHVMKTSGLSLSGLSLLNPLQASERTPVFPNLKNGECICGVMMSKLNDSPVMSPFGSDGMLTFCVIRGLGSMRNRDKYFLKGRDNLVMKVSEKIG